MMQQPQPKCPQCSLEAEWIHHYSRWYCRNCINYLDVPPTPKPFPEKYPSTAQKKSKSKKVVIVIVILLIIIISFIAYSVYNYNLSKPVHFENIQMEENQNYASVNVTGRIVNNHMNKENVKISEISLIASGNVLFDSFTFYLDDIIIDHTSSTIAYQESVQFIIVLQIRTYVEHDITDELVINLFLYCEGNYCDDYTINAESLYR